MSTAIPRVDPEDGQSVALLQQVLDTIPDPIFVKDLEHRWIAVNDAFCRLIGHPREALLGRSDPDFWPPEQTAVFWHNDDLVFRSGESNENEETATGADGVERTLWTRKIPLRDAADRVTGLCGVVTEITALKQRMREAERIERENAEHRGLIAAQAAMLAELTMPVVEVGDRILLVPLIGELSQRRVATANEEMLASIARLRARFVLFDMTGVPTIDTAVARDLLRTLDAAALLGCRGALCGIRPEIAQMLVALDVKLGAFQTFATLRAGLAYASRT
ncbi:MAG TPA: PAS domain-containing protein [Nannocystis sp.]|jgi:rsbT co-antagonist protein RsbR